MSRTREVRVLGFIDNLRLGWRYRGAAVNLIRDLVRREIPAPFPRRIGLFITNRCDLACPMCAVQDVRNEGLKGRGDMPFNVIECVLGEVGRYQPIIDFIGGEPLLYSRLGEAIQLANKQRALAVVTTNGLRLEENAERLVRAGLPMLQVSLDGWDISSQAARGRVPDSFQKLCAGVRAVQQAKGSSPFPIIRILTAITRVNHAHLDRIQRVVASLDVRYWGVSNYFYLNRSAHNRHAAFVLTHGLSGHATAHAISEDTYLSPEQVQALRLALSRVQEQNRRLRLRIAYAWDVDIEEYYSPRQPSRSCSCDLPYNRLDVHTDGHIAVCVSGKRIGQIGHESIAEVWKGTSMRQYRAMYQREKPMPMCFRCCGLSQSIRFDPDR